jgi:hypothetical protein
MRPNSRTLAMRDTALAAAMGILGAPGSTYGAERRPSFGSEWANDAMGTDINDPGYYGYHGGSQGFGHTGWGFGADPAAAPAAMTTAKVPASHPLHPAQHARTIAVVAQHNAVQARTAQRKSLLHPNEGSNIDIERYDFSLNQTPNLVLGTASTIAMSIQPAVTVRPQRCSFNAPSYGFAQISSILSANVNGLVGGSLDAGAYSSTAFGVHLDLPTLSPANKLAINGTYSGLVPPGFPLAFSFPFTASFQCPATVVA